jgi:asparagine synthase (glutamine-hydrolysing)
VATLFNTRHVVDEVTVDKVRSIAPAILNHLAEPMGDPSLIPTAHLCSMVAEHVKVALGGDGGDELFAGYDPFKAVAPARLYERLIPKPVHRGIRALFDLLPVSHANMSLDFKIKRTLKGLSWPRSIRNAVWLGPLGPDELSELFSAPMDMEELYEEAIDIWEKCDQNNPIEATLQFYTRLYLTDNILVKTDRASMMHSLEVRSPFLDKDLVEFVRKLPWQMKYNKGTTKYLLKKTVSRWLPDEIVYRKKKGFGLPIGKWFRTGGLPLSCDKLPTAISGDYIATSLAQHVAGKTDSRLLLWNSFVLNHFGTN